MSYRTAAQIATQIEARKAEIEAEALTPAYRFPCRTCKWQREFGGSWTFPSWRYCKEPLVEGLEQPHDLRMGIPALCGPERALWQPKLSWWQRLLNWLFG